MTAILSTGSVSGYENLTGTYELDPDHTRIGFIARHAMVTKVHGRFTEFSGTVFLDGADPSASHAEVVIAAASIDTRNSARDAHLRSNDFLAMDDYPEITFRSTQVEQLAAADFRLTGDLTIRGTTRPVTIDLHFNGSGLDESGNFRVGFEGSTVINRRDWGVNWNAALETGGVLVSNKVTLEFDISAIKVA